MRLRASLKDKIFDTARYKTPAEILRAFCCRVYPLRNIKLSSYCSFHHKIAERYLKGDTMRYGIFIAMFIPGLLLAQPGSSSALDFDCDVPANRYSSVSAVIDGLPTVMGKIHVVEMRSGNNLPVVGGRIVSVDGGSSLGFQLVAPSPKSSKLDIVLNLNRGNGAQRNILGQIETKDEISFNLSLLQNGKLFLNINDINFTTNFINIEKSKVMIFCSTGQFKFSDLYFNSKD